jgi:hypothetical protein
MKIMSKKVKFFGRSIPAVAIALIAIAALASAGLLSYYGMITGTATVSQSVLVDGYDITHGTITEPFSVKGGETKETSHTITDQSSQAALVKLDSVITSGPYGGDGVRITYGFTLSSLNSTTPGEEVDVLRMPVGMTWSELINVSYTFRMTSAENKNCNNPFVVLYIDSDNDGKVDGMYSTPQTTEVTCDVEATKTWVKSDFFKVYGTDVTGDTRILSVGIDVGWQGSAETNPGAQTTKLKEVKINGNLISKPGIVVVIGGTNNPAPTRTLDFSIIYDFALEIYPGTYTIETKVIPAGPGELAYHP